jgi:hypothetical protein
MKTLILAAIAFVNFAPATTVVTKLNLQTESTVAYAEPVKGPAKILAWNQCVAFINDNSTSIDPGVMIRLQGEVFSGVKTWGINPSPSSNILFAPLTGGSMGWVDEEIEFANEDDLSTAVNLVIAVTNMDSN